MASTTFGDFGAGIVQQPGMSINYKSDGVAEGQVKYRCDVSSRSNLPGLGFRHPLEPTAICHDIALEEIGNGILEATLSFHGVSYESGENTRPTIEYPGSCDQLPIEVHPRFKIIAGTPQKPENGALWVDPVTRKESKDPKAEFDGFRNPAFPRFYGTEVFFQNRPLVYRIYASTTPPVLQQGCTIVESIPGFSNPPGIVNWLLLDTPFQQVGNNSYRVTEQYKGSPAPGWNPELYRKG